MQNVEPSGIEPASRKFPRAALPPVETILAPSLATCIPEPGFRMATHVYSTSNP